MFLAAASTPDRVEAATIDHGLRAESGDEAQFVAEICAGLGIEHRIVQVELSQTGNLQANARSARYEALASWRDERGLSAIATAHHTDDQAETLLMRLNRGSGLAGLSGVRGVGKNPSDHSAVLRPLLSWRKAELEAVCDAAGIVPVRDPSNEDASFDRVRLRKALAETDWIDPQALAQSAQHLGEVEDFVERAIARAYDERTRESGQGITYTPSGSRFESIETVRLIFAQLSARPSRSEIAQCVDRLGRGENASLAGVLARAEGDNWHFAPEPPRRAGET